uniref:putative ubiquitin-conjugating enzyme E2 38 n=1 Tax=Erigeron canadensis TaxID=72917 RepID=UPI001CB9D4AA|nr:putative ubiquitin-conjugating enzyme E2 38 [Erigeron canadensis]
MSGLFGPGLRVETGLIDPHQSTQRLKDRGLWTDPNEYPLGTVLAVTSCTVVEVLVKDDTSVKKGDPLFVLYRPLPPPPTTPLSPFSPMPEYLKIQIKESLKQRQQHQSATIVDNTHKMPTRLLHHNVDAAQLLLNFKRFDTVVDYSDHLFSAESSPETQQAPIDWVNKIQEDRRILKERLPDTIFVRVFESRMDILRAAIVGQKGTPYHDGLFFFDMCFPINYPDSPPLVRYHSGVPGISPHLNKCGDVRLVLCNEFARQENMWIPGTSNMLQLLVSIQDLILNATPYFNIIGTAMSISRIQERKSFLFNENTVVKSLETMVYTMNKPPKNFEDLVFGHFHMRVHDILMACKGYIKGQQEVGCLVSDSNHAPSMKFKKDVTSCIKPLVNAFENIGAKEAQEYLYLTEKKRATSANVPTPVNEGINDAAHKKRKVEVDINHAAKKERKVVVVKEASDPTEKESMVDVGIIVARNLMKKVNISFFTDLYALSWGIVFHAHIDSRVY